MKMMIIMFAVCSLVNVILSTIKSVLTVKGSKGIATVINAITYGFYTLVVKQMANVGYFEAVLITVVTNIIGVYFSLWLLEKMKKDKLWRITVNAKNEKQLDRIAKELGKYNIGYTLISGCFNIDIYSYTQKDSSIVKKIIEENNVKYFIQTMEKSL